MRKYTASDTTATTGAILPEGYSLGKSTTWQSFRICPEKCATYPLRKDFLMWRIEQKTRTCLGAGHKMSKTIDRLESNVRSYARLFPTVFKSAAGSRITDEQGRDYIDFFCSAGSANYGHNPAEINEALIGYIQANGIQSSLDMMSSAKVEFLEKFEQVILAPRDMEYRVQFTGPTGSSAVEAAIMLAKKQTCRNHVIAFTNACHGNTLGSLSLNANQRSHSEFYGAHNNVTHFPFDGYLGEQVDTSALLEKMLDDSGSGLPKPAAVVLETVQIAGGVHVASTKWLRRVSKACQKRDIRLIVDDSQAGCGRAGQFFSFEQSGIKPDIVCLAKSIGGGLPMSLNLIRRDLDTGKPNEHASTFRGSNLSFVAASASLGYWSAPSFELEILQRGTRVKTALEQIASLGADFDTQVRGRGMIWGLDVRNGLIAKEVCDLAFQRGLLISCAGSQQEVVKIQPSLNIPHNLLEQGLSILRNCVADVMQFRRTVSKPLSQVEPISSAKPADSSTTTQVVVQVPPVSVCEATV
jgi:diaminobutyrate-2-oxoglutarate transaminase